MTNDDFITRLTEQIAQIQADSKEHTPAQPVDATAVAEAPPPPPELSINPGLHLLPQVKEMKTVDELAAMILNDLRQVEGCPKDGVNVTVYGLNPWNVWLSFGAAAGPVYNKVELQVFCDILTERLKRLYDVDALSTGT